MFTKFNVAFVALSLLSVTESVVGRYNLLERDDRFVALRPRRFGEQNPSVISRIAAACPGQVCGNLSGQAITPLLAAQGECTQQDMADAIIDAAQQFSDPTKSNMIALAIEYRQVEKNTPPDFTTNPPTNRNSVFCQKAPKHAELNNLVQAQDPANNPNIFFDPATGKSVQKGSQANTSPFKVGSGAASNSSTTATKASVSQAISSAASSTAAASAASQVLIATAAADPCAVTVTVTIEDTVTVTATPAASSSAASAAATVTDQDNSAATATVTGSSATSTASSSDIGNFGKCSVPQIEFGVGFDGRKETSFQPVDKTSFNHGSAQAIGIITQFVCDTLTNTCGADATAKATCAKALAAANAVTPAKSGGQADAFNAVFGIKTDFAAVTALDDQGRPIAGTGADAQGSASVASATAATSSTAAAETSAAATPTGTTASAPVEVSAKVDATATAEPQSKADSSAVSEAPSPTETSDSSEPSIKATETPAVEKTPTADETPAKEDTPTVATPSAAAAAATPSAAAAAATPSAADESEDDSTTDA
ncbi:hypothetical protein BDW22DRAFT_158073 [Trametopsis cervina]|nr:hypothetical protein BDW22DRAFT_158073 [Trametopsis cervina]